MLSRVRLFATPWTVAHQAPLSMAFPGKNTESGLPFPLPGDLPDPGEGKPASPVSPANADDPGDVGLIPGSGRSPGAGKWQPTPVFLPGESMDREVWPATVHGIAELDTTE